MAAGLGLAAVALGARSLLRPHRLEHPNLLVVTIDTLRADHVGAYGYSGAATPTLDGLARTGVRFENAETTIPLTGPAHSTIFTGHYPPVHGVRNNAVFPLPDKHPTLAALLKGKGYRTAAFVAAYPVGSAFGFSQGFDEFSEAFHNDPVFIQAAETPANEVADAALSWLAKPGHDPFFLWVHFYDPHAPYRPPSPFREKFVAQPYDGEIAFADAQLGRVLDGLRAAGHGDDTLVVAVGDHGEALGEHKESTHGILIYQSTLRVPLILAGPGVPEKRVVASRVGTVDILPTVLRLLGVDPPEGLPGRDLRPALGGERLSSQPFYAESLFGRLCCGWSSLRGWVSEDWKLIEGREPELYDLTLDPSESTNRASDEPARVTRMREALRTAVAKMAPGGDAAHPAPLSPEAQERLAALGYTGGTDGGGDLDEPGRPDPRAMVHLYERLQSNILVQGAAVTTALAETAAIAEQDPGNSYAFFVLGSLAYRAGRPRLALEAFGRALAMEPMWVVVRFAYAHVLRDLGRLGEAERQLRIAVEQAPADDRTRVYHAELLIILGKVDEAERIVTDVLRKTPGSIEANGAMGRILLARSRPLEAIPHLEKAAVGPAPEPWIQLAVVHLVLGDGERALGAAGEALRRNPNHLWAMATSGHALVLVGRRAEGVAVLKRVLSARPQSPDVWMSLARAFDAAGETATAAVCRREARSIARS